MDLDPATLLVLFSHGESHIRFQRVVDGEMVAEVPLAHKVFSGTSQDDMIVTVGFEPNSVIILDDRHTPEQQQQILFARWPKAVAISPAKDTIAVMLIHGVVFDVEAGHRLT